MLRQAERGPSAATPKGLSVPFEALLAKLREAHWAEVEVLRHEKDELSAQLSGVLEPASRWREGCGGLSDKVSKATAHAAVPLSASRAPHCPPLSLQQPRSHSGPLPPDDHRPNSCVRQEGSCASANGSPDNCGRFSFTPTSRFFEGNVSREHTQSDATRRKSPTRSWTVRISRQIFEDVAPTSLNLRMLSMEKYPGQEWSDLEISQKAELLRSALRPKHWLINPQSDVVKYWDILLGLSVLFVGLITPYEVVFVSKVDWNLFVLNRIVDAIFLVDIVLQFFLMVEIQRPHYAGTVMLRDPKVLRARYLKSWFIIDLVGIFPFDIVSMLASSGSSLMLKVKIMRCIKLLRLAKLLRMLRGSKVIQRWKNEVAIPFANQKLLRFSAMLVFVAHWLACLWGFVGLTLGAELCSEEGLPLGRGVDTAEVSWVTTLFLGGKTSPDDPCSHFAVYAASLYWSVMTLTSIGYGDIVPVRQEEYLVGISCMFVGGVLWAYAIGSVCSIISNSSVVERNFEANTDLLNFAMREAHVPSKERHKYREYLREATAFDRRVHFRKIAERFSPLLRKELMYHVTKHNVGAVYYFQDPDAPRALLTDIAYSLVPKFFSRREPLGSLRHDLCMMDRGTVARGELILVPPSVFNEDFITEKKFKVDVRTVSLTYSQILVLTRKALEELLHPYPKFERKIRVYAMKLAFCRAMQMIKRHVDSPPNKPGVSAPRLCKAFDDVCREASTALVRRNALASTPPEG